MKNVGELRGEAERCRRLAKSIDDAEMKAVLETMVEELEAKIAAAERLDECPQRQS